LIVGSLGRIHCPVSTAAAVQIIAPPIQVRQCFRSAEVALYQAILTDAETQAERLGRLVRALDAGRQITENRRKVRRDYAQLLDWLGSDSHELGGDHGVTLGAVCDILSAASGVPILREVTARRLRAVLDGGLVGTATRGHAGCGKVRQVARRERRRVRIVARVAG